MFRGSDYRSGVELFPPFNMYLPVHFVVSTVFEFTESYGKPASNSMYANKADSDFECGFPPRLGLGLYLGSR